MTTCDLYLIYIVRWRCTTSCDLVRPCNIILRYPTKLGIASSQDFEHHKSSQDIARWPLMAAMLCNVTRLHTIYRRWSAITVIYQSYVVVWRRKGRCDCGFSSCSNRSLFLAMHAKILLWPIIRLTILLWVILVLYIAFFLTHLFRSYLGSTMFPTHVTWMVIQQHGFEEV